MRRICSATFIGDVLLSIIFLPILAVYFTNACLNMEKGIQINPPGHLRQPPLRICGFTSEDNVTNCHSEILWAPKRVHFNPLTGAHYPYNPGLEKSKVWRSWPAIRQDYSSYVEEVEAKKRKEEQIRLALRTTTRKPTTLSGILYDLGADYYGGGRLVSASELNQQNMDRSSSSSQAGDFGSNAGSRWLLLGPNGATNFQSNSKSPSSGPPSSFDTAVGIQESEWDVIKSDSSTDDRTFFFAD